jgi:hypothetical protein
MFILLEQNPELNILTDLLWSNKWKQKIAYLPPSSKSSSVIHQGTVSFFISFLGGRGVLFEVPKESSES